MGVRWGSKRYRAVIGKEEFASHLPWGRGGAGVGRELKNNNKKIKR